jgi:formate/nitrite transporter FocA (FNT family)
MPASGTSQVQFGYSYGAVNSVQLTVTGQSAISATSQLGAWIRLQSTADHSADEHMSEALAVTAGNIVAGTGFTINVYCVNSWTYGLFNIDWAYN